MREIVVSLFLFGLARDVLGYSRGGPCQAADNMTPNPAYHGKPQDSDINPPPFKLHVINPDGYVAKEYSPNEVYTVRISGSTYFRGFLVQARRVLNGRITAERVGRFEQEASWSRVGVQYQECDSTEENSVTHIDARRKYYLNLKWIPDKRVGPVQFTLSIVQNQTYFWANWLPEKGLLKESSPIKITPSDVSKPVVPKLPTSVTSRKVSPKRPVPTVPSSPSAPARKSPAPRPRTRPTPVRPRPTAQQPKKAPEPELPGPKTIKTLPFVVPPASTVDRDQPAPKPVELEPLPLAPRPHDEEGDPYPLGPSGPRVHPPPTKKEVVAVAPFAYVEVIPTPILVRIAAEREKSKEKEPSTYIDPSEYGKDFCASNPCKNDASCENEPTGFYCVCPSGYTGTTCDTYDYCAKSPCTQNGVCQLNEFGYECVCDRGFSGRKCELRCPEYVCKNGGTCFVDNTNSYACKCPPGWTGKSCEKNINECEGNPCQNGGTCEDLQNNYRCNCHQGFHGKKCQRLCVDVYRSCGNQWKDEDRCDTMRYLTRFFEVNCPVACGSCTGLDRNLLDSPPLPPKLEPFRFLLGKWSAKVAQKENFPIKMNEPFESVMEFVVSEVPMFGSPSVNYTITSTDQNNRSVVVVNGFFMLARTQPITISVSSVSNAGFTLIEEGRLNTTTNRLDLISVFSSTLPRIKPLFPKLIRRSIFPSGNYLTVRMDTVDNSGNEKMFQHYYSRLENYQPLKAGPIVLVDTK